MSCKPPIKAFQMLLWRSGPYLLQVTLHNGKVVPSAKSCGGIRASMLVGPLSGLTYSSHTYGPISLMYSSSLRIRQDPDGRGMLQLVKQVYNYSNCLLPAIVIAILAFDCLRSSAKL